MARPQGTRQKQRASPRKVLGLAFLAVLSLLAATAEERTFGSITDEQQMLGTAVSMAEFGEIGIARGPLFTVHRTAGDAVSPYGVGLSLLEVVPSVLASQFERSFGAGSSQALFVFLQILLVAGAALGAALLASELGAGISGTLVALFGTAFGSPLWAYIASGYSEPLQALSIVFCLLLALRAVRPGPESLARARAFAAGAGALAGAAVLAKSMNVVLIPFLLAPLVLDRMEGVPSRIRASLLAAAAAGGLVPFMVWLVFEVVRFGRPFASYGGTGFNHPFFDGFWRLLIGPNKGLLVYFPLAFLALIALLPLAKRRRGAAVAIGGSLVMVLALSSAWWAWDGTVGWGPRLLVPVIPLLAAAAGWKMSGESLFVRRAGFALLGCGVLVNILGVLQNEAATAAYVSSMQRAVIPGKDADRFPPGFTSTGGDGRTTIDRQHLAALDPTLAPIRVHAFLLGVRLGSSNVVEQEKRLAEPPWLAARPELVPRLASSSSTVLSLVSYLKTPFVWPHLAASLSRPADVRADAFNMAYDAALADQVLRALDCRNLAHALSISERLFSLTPSGYSAALHAESLRSAGRRETLEQFLGTLPPEFQSSPNLGVVQALLMRDRGDEAGARELVSRLARVFPRPGLIRAEKSPIADWPEGLHGMTGENLADRRLEMPRLGKRR